MSSDKIHMNAFDELIRTGSLNMTPANSAMEQSVFASQKSMSPPFHKEEELKKELVNYYKKLRIGSTLRTPLVYWVLAAVLGISLFFWFQKCPPIKSNNEHSINSDSIKFIDTISVKKQIPQENLLKLQNTTVKESNLKIEDSLGKHNQNSVKKEIQLNYKEDCLITSTQHKELNKEELKDSMKTLAFVTEQKSDSVQKKEVKPNKEQKVLKHTCELPLTYELDYKHRTHELTIGFEEKLDRLADEIIYCSNLKTIEIYAYYKTRFLFFKNMKLHESRISRLKRQLRKRNVEYKDLARGKVKISYRKANKKEAAESENKIFVVLQN